MSGGEWTVRRSDHFLFRYEVRHPNGGFMGSTITLWGARRAVRKLKRSERSGNVVYREPS